MYSAEATHPLLCQFWRPHVSLCHVQNAEGFRKRALEGIKVITYLQEFANVGSLPELPELFRDDNRLAEAAVWLQQL